MAAAANNNIIQNHAYIGFIAGVMSGRAPGVVPGLKAAALVFAAAVDAAIPNDALITTGAGVTQLAITTNTIAANEMARSSLIRDLSAAAIRDRFTTDATPGDWTAMGVAVAAVYTDALTNLVTP